MAHPYLGKYKVTKLYGTPPPLGVTYSAGKHSGIDLVGLDTKEVRAICSGTVYRSSYDYDGWGKYVVVKQVDGLYAIYCHMSKSYKAVGQVVRTGDMIGIEGATGQVTGAHLHLELRKLYDDKYSTINPADYLEIQNKLGIAEKAVAEVTEQKFIFPSGNYKKYDFVVKDGHVLTANRDVLTDFFADQKLPYWVDYQNGVIVIKKK